MVEFKSVSFSLYCKVCAGTNSSERACERVVNPASLQPIGDIGRSCQLPIRDNAVPFDRRSVRFCY